MIFKEFYFRLKCVRERKTSISYDDDDDDDHCLTLNHRNDMLHCKSKSEKFN